MNFLSGQHDFFQTANQPISVRHSSLPYNKAGLKVLSKTREDDQFEICMLPISFKFEI